MKLEQIAAVVALLLLPCPARASASTVVQGRTFSVGLHDLTRLNDGAVGGTFSTVGVFPRFNPAVGALTSVDVEWYFEGEMQVGIFPRGPNFPPGSGTASGESTLDLLWDIPNSFSVIDSQTLEGTRSGSIDPSLGFEFEINRLILPFSNSGELFITDLSEVASFVGTTPFHFAVNVGAHGDVDVTVPGPRFGIQLSLPGAHVSVTYTYVPEPSTLVLAVGIFAPLAARRRRRG